MRNVVRAFALKSTVSHFICLADSQGHLWQVSNRPPYSSREYRSFRAPFVYSHHHPHSLQTTHTHSTPPHSPVTASQSTGTRHYLIKLDTASPLFVSPCNQHSPTFDTHSRLLSNSHRPGVQPASYMLQSSIGTLYIQRSLYLTCLCDIILTYNQTTHSSTT